jgi:hypothetical protein
MVFSIVLAWTSVGKKLGSEAPEIRVDTSGEK